MGITVHVGCLDGLWVPSISVLWTSGGQFWIFWHQVDNIDFFDIRWTILNFLKSGGQFWIFWHQVDNFEFFVIRWTILNFLTSGGQFWTFCHQVGNFEFFDIRWPFWIFWHQVDDFEFFDIRWTILNFLRQVDNFVLKRLQTPRPRVSGRVNASTCHDEDGKVREFFQK